MRLTKPHGRGALPGPTYLGHTRAMLPFADLAATVLSEAATAAVVLVQDDPGAIRTPTEKLAELTRWAPLPNVRQLAEVIEALFWASTMNEEARTTQFRVVFRPDDADDGAFVPITRFRSPPQLSPRSLKKLAPAHDGC